MEHRSVQRYRVSLPISFYWGTGTNFVEGAGDSRDLSIHGAFVRSSDAVPSGSDIWLKVLIPTIGRRSKGSAMQGTGRVVRVDTEGFAVEAVIEFSNRSGHKQKDQKIDSGNKNEPEYIGQRY